MSLLSQILRDFRLPSQGAVNFYTCSFQSILTEDITARFDNGTKQDRQAVQRVVCSAEFIIQNKPPDLQTMYYKRCRNKVKKIVQDPSHPNNRQFFL